MKGRVWHCLLFAAVMFTAPETPMAQSQVYIQGDLTVRPAPPPPPPSERLAYAQRLFDADRFAEVIDEVREIAESAAFEAPEALFLMARAQYSQGRAGRAAAHFEELLMRHPNSAPVRSGRLAGRLEQAAIWLVEERSWRLAGRYLELLRQVDTGAVAGLARVMEDRVEAELAEYQALLNNRRRNTASEMEKWLAGLDRQQQEFCQIITACNLRDRVCYDKAEKWADSRVRDNKEKFRKEWYERSEKVFQEMRRDFARPAMEDAQRFVLLRELLSTGIVLDSVRPANLNWRNSPYLHYVRTEDFERHPEGLRSFSFKKDPWVRWKVCRSQEQEVMARMSFPALHFTTINRERVLERLGELLRTGQGQDAVRARRL